MQLGRSVYIIAVFVQLQLHVHRQRQKIIPAARAAKYKFVQVFVFHLSTPLLVFEKTAVKFSGKDRNFCRHVLNARVSGAGKTYAGRCRQNGGIPFVRKCGAAAAVHLA